MRNVLLRDTGPSRVAKMLILANGVLLPFLKVKRFNAGAAYAIHPGETGDEEPHGPEEIDRAIQVVAERALLLQRR